MYRLIVYFSAQNVGQSIVLNSVLNVRCLEYRMPDQTHMWSMTAKCIPCDETHLSTARECRINQEHRRQLNVAAKEAIKEGRLQATCVNNRITGHPKKHFYLNENNPWTNNKIKVSQQNSDDLLGFILNEMKKLNDQIDNKMNDLGKVIMDFLPAVTLLLERLYQSNGKKEIKQQQISDYTEKFKMIMQPIVVITKSFTERNQRSRDFGINISNCTAVITSIGNINSIENILAPEITDPGESF
ncbi:unnamed protein product [Didymodactylos carnosus]|uniref:Uncharacterized protein n=1 Tax=Didymodactylos carnosus TaxID=1234261 RepID=A0A814R6I9_9BILA|nr:unnamed protein product [Didymodactylos carnosus]CAF3892496.1 unnamed protein product [Didymodactylos carnosus]